MTKATPPAGADDPSFWLQLEAATRREDPLERFIASLGPEMAAFSRETVKLRRELEEHTRAALIEEPRRALLHAEWIAKHAVDVSWRWANLRDAACRWSALDLESFRFKVAP